MSRNCEKGKPCGATCIYRRKICRKELSIEVSRGLDRASERPSAGLNKLETSEDFRLKEEETYGYYSEEIEKAHNRLNSLLEGKDLVKQEALYKGLGEGDIDKGKAEVRLARLGITLFTGDYHDEMRQLQMNNPPNPSVKDAKYLKMIDNIERLLSSPEIEKPAVEKFRGIAVNSETLDGMIQSSKNKERYEGRALSSWSTSLMIASSYSEPDRSGDKQERVIFRAINSKGVATEGMTVSPGEYEVLTSGTAKYKYLKYREINDNGAVYHIFDVEEL